MNRELFGSFVAETRRGAGMTQKALADKLHVTDKAVSKWERGLCYPDITLIEPLAEALGLGMTELLSCRRSEPEAAVDSLMDISSEAVRKRKADKWIWALIAAFLALLIAAGAWFSTVATETVHGSVELKQIMDGEYCVFIEKDGHLLRLRCPDRESWESIQSGADYSHAIRCRYNRLTGHGVLLGCSESAESLGGYMDTVGSSISLDEGLLGRRYAYIRTDNIYPDPNRERGFIRTYSFWCYRDGSSELAYGEAQTFLRVEQCRAALSADYDSDGVVELCVLTRWDEQPWLLYEIDGEGDVSASFVDSFPDKIMLALENEY